jgi:hypothetical protein
LFACGSCVVAMHLRVVPYALILLIALFVQVLHGRKRTGKFPLVHGRVNRRECALHSTEIMVNNCKGDSNERNYKEIFSETTCSSLFEIAISKAKASCIFFYAHTRDLWVRSVL